MRNLKRVLSLAVASVMMIGMMVVGTGAAYADVDSADNREAIEVLQMIGLMEGDEKGNFNPDKNVTRNEIAVIMANLLDLNLGGTTPFTDVPAWAQDYVAACYNNGIVAGTSATTYGGDTAVTPAQAALMLLKACGYFQYQGEFEDDWQMAVVKRGGQVDLFDDVSAAVTSPMSRNDVAQMVLNALETTMVMVTQEGGIQVDGNGMSVVVNPTYRYENAEDLTGVNYNNATRGSSSQETRQLCEDLYGNALKKSEGSTVTDDFQRPAVKWTYKTQSVTAPKEPTLTYTASVKGRDIYADMGRTAVEASSVTAYIDGVAVDKDTDGTSGAIMDSTFAINASETSSIGGNGILTEVYYDDDTTSVSIVMMSNYAAVVNDCAENKNGGYDIDLVVSGGTTKAYNSPVAYEEESVVVYTRTINATDVETYADAQAAGTSEIKSMYQAELITGTVTRVKDEDSFSLDGESYSYAKMFNDADAGKLTASDVNYDTDVYMDAEGNVVMLANVGAGTSYAVVVDTRGGSWTKGDDEAKLLFPDGSVEIVTVSDKGATPEADHLYTYTRNSKNIYTLYAAGDLTAKTSTAVDSLDGDQGKAKVIINETGVYYANSKTVFFYYDKNADEYSSWTGIDNYPGFSNGTTDYSYAVDGTVNGTLKAVYIMADSDVTDGSTTTSFLYVKGDEKQIIDADLGNYYELKAVVDGEIQTVMIAAEAYPGSSVMVNKINVNDDNIITSVGKVADSNGTLDGNGDGAIVGKAVTIADVRNGNITFTVDGTNKEFVYSKDVKVYEYNTSESGFYTKAVTSLRDQTFTAGKIFVQIDNAAVVNIYYVK